MPFKLFNRLDVKDSRNKWLETNIVELNKDYFKIHYKGWSAKFDEYLPILPENNLIDVKYAEIGLYSNAYGQAKYKNQKEARDKQKMQEGSLKKELN